MAENDGETLVLRGKVYLKKDAWARARNVHPRTVDRHREKGGLPSLTWGGEVYIPEIEGDDYILSLVKARNPPRRRRASRLQATAGNAA
jgi:hypothetical protein